MPSEAFEMSIASDLRKLALKRGTLEYLEEYYAQIDAEQNDRGAAILACTFLENALEIAISRRLSGSGKIFDRLFLNEGPLGTFDAKILIADALDIYGTLTRQNIITIKHVRNAFAHCSIPIDFSTKEIAVACDSFALPSPNPQRYRDSLPFDTARSKYTTICEVTATAFINYAAACVRARSDIIPIMRPGQMIPVTPDPLP
jgi:hypothetical protein